MPFDYQAFKYGMATGFAGDVNRSHPQSSIEPGLNDATNPVAFYGQGVLLTSTGTYRGILTSDTATVLAGIAARPYPIQQATASNFGAVTMGGTVLPPAGEIDILRQGYILVPVVVGATALVKGGTVYMWVAASSGAHLLGGFESTTSGSTVTLTNCRWNGNAGADNIAELVLNVF